MVQLLPFHVAFMLHWYHLWQDHNNAQVW